MDEFEAEFVMEFELRFMCEPAEPVDECELALVSAEYVGLGLIGGNSGDDGPNCVGEYGTDMFMLGLE